MSISEEAEAEIQEEVKELTEKIRKLPWKEQVRWALEVIREREVICGKNKTK